MNLSFSQLRLLGLLLFTLDVGLAKEFLMLTLFLAKASCLARAAAHCLADCPFFARSLLLQSVR